jgi:hypothetical protein
LGLNDDTADMFHPAQHIGKDIVRYSDPQMLVHNDHFEIFVDDQPAWSLHRLIAMLPDFFSNLGRQFNLKMDKCFLRYCTARNDEYIYFQQKDTLYDNIIDCIEWLIKENKFNKEYLKDK